jgi:ribosomal protein L29
MVEPLAALAGVVTTAKRLLEVAKKIKDAEVKNLIADLNLQLADLKMQLAAIQSENLLLRGQLTVKSQAVDYRSKLVLRGKVYHFTEPVENRPLGPYCPRCFEADGKLMLVTELEGPFQQLADHMCPNCKATY